MQQQASGSEGASHNAAGVHGTHQSDQGIARAAQDSALDATSPGDHPAAVRQQGQSSGAGDALHAGADGKGTGDEGQGEGKVSPGRSGTPRQSLLGRLGGGLRNLLGKTPRLQVRTM